MSDSAPLDVCTITLGNVPATDAFGLNLLLDSEEMIETVNATGPGLFRHWRTAADHSRSLLHQGSILGFLQRGVLLMPVLMPCDGWLLDRVADGARVEHDSPIVRFLRTTGVIIP